MSKFKVGDRLRCYFGRVVNDLILSSVTEDGMLFFAEKDNIGHMNYLAHPKQCRRLVKIERRRVWVALKDVQVGGLGTKFCYAFFYVEKGDKNLVEFIEVRKKK